MTDLPSEACFRRCHGQGWSTPREDEFPIGPCHSGRIGKVVFPWSGPENKVSLPREATGWFSVSGGNESPCGHVKGERRMFFENKRVVALFVDRSSQQWIVYDLEG